MNYVLLALPGIGFASGLWLSSRRDKSDCSLSIIAIITTVLILANAVTLGWHR